MNMAEAWIEVTRRPCNGIEGRRTKEMQLRSFTWDSPMIMAKAWIKVTRRPCDGIEGPQTKEMHVHSFS